MGRGGGGRGKHGGEESSGSGSDESSDSEDVEEEQDHPFFGVEAEKYAAAAGIADEDDDGMVARSPFGSETFESAAACWAHAAKEHGFSLAKLREQVGRDTWTDYHRIRVVNFLRSLGPEAALKQAASINADSIDWADEKWLKPVMDDDFLLFDDEGLDEDGEWDMVTGPAAGSPGTSTAVGGPPPEEPVDLATENERLRSELASARRLLAVTALDEAEPSRAIKKAALTSDDEGSSASCFSLDQSRSFMFNPSMAEVVRQLLLTKPELLEGKTVLDVGCCSGVLSSLCAKMGAKSVTATDPSSAMVTRARAVLAASGQDSKVELLDGATEEELSEQIRDRGGDGYDLLVSERLLSDLRYGPGLVKLFKQRRRHLSAGGRVLPGSVVLRLCAADYSEECKSYTASSKDASFLGGLFSEGGFPRVLAPDFATPPSMEAAVVVPRERIASVKDDMLKTLHFGKDSADEALLEKESFSFNLKPDRYMTALVLYAEVCLDSDGAVISASPSAAASGTAGDGGVTGPASWAQRGLRQTVFHMPGAEPATSQPLLLPGSEYPQVEGTISTCWDGDDIEVTIDLKARHKGKGPLPRSTATFLLRA